ncbi:MAG: J domain-containing protein [Bacteroidia bacterium]|nr:J domain-containing protein [Bacteroidia bacterium]
MINSQDYYKILGVSQKATLEEIKAAYHSLAKQHHPDKNNGNAQSEELFKQITQAYETLNDPQKRKDYDAKYAKDYPPQAEFSGFNEYQHLFEQVFTRKQSSRSRVPNSGDYEAKIQISLLDAFQGGEKIITLQKKKRIRLRLKPGIKNGQVLRLKGYGAPARPGLAAGDLFLNIVIEKHPLFHLEKNDLHTQVNISAYKAILGGEVIFKHLNDQPIKLTLKPGTQPGTTIKLREKGMPAQNTHATGDLYVKLNILIPTNLTEQEQQIIAELEKNNPNKL